MPTATTVDEYIAAWPDDRRVDLEAIRAIIRAAAPEAIETISYDIPAYRVDGRVFIYFAAFARHYSIFPATGAIRERLGDEVAPYIAGKGTLRFPAGQPLPTSLIERIVAIRLEEHRVHGAD